MFSKASQPIEVESNNGLFAKAEDGDIVVQLTHPVAQNNQLDSKNIIENAGHCGILIGLRIVHATVGRHNFGGNVRAGHIDNVLPKEDAMGSVMIFRIKNKLLKKYLVELASLYLYPNSSRFTPFSYYNSRRPDKYPDESAHKRLEFFRAFRVSQRIKEGTPITKNKGVSCVSFVRYMIKTALIRYFFPEGLPAELLDHLNKIETLRKQNNKKLDAISPDLFNAFEACALKNVAQENKELFAELYQILKTTSLGEFCRSVLANSGLWEVGYFYYADSINKPCILQHALYTTLDLRLFEKLKLNSNAVEFFSGQKTKKAL